MDNLTHTLFGMTLARTPLGRAGRGTTAALLLASNAPDIDIVALAGGPVSYLRWHRGPTHGPLGIVGLGLATAAIVWIGRRLYDRRQGARSASETRDHDASFLALAAVAMMGVLLHVLMDVPTSYGTRLLSPFDWHWFAVDLMPIVDIYLLAVLAAGIAFGQRSPAAGRRNAAIVLSLMAANYGVRAVGHHQALALMPALFGPTLPRPCDPQPVAHSMLDSWPAAAPIVPDGPRCLIDAAALPTFTSPLQWTVVLKLSNAYELRDLDLLDARWRNDEDPFAAPWRTTVRYPNVWTPVVTRAGQTRTGEAFLGFSRFPAARSAIDSRGVTTVRLTDVRFATGLASLDQRRPGSGLFTATVQIGPDGAIQQERLGR